MVLAVYLALLRAAGEFVGTLVIGVYIIWCVITLMRIDNLVWGGIVGACLATAILVLTGLVCCPPFWAFVASGLVYPTLGYPLGILCAGCKQIDAC